MKKFLVIILSFLMAVFLVGCSITFIPEDKGDGDTSGGTDSSGGDDEGGLVFKVTLLYENKPFYPETTIYAQWTGDEGVYSTPFNVFGIAEIRGLDGDYRVNLSNIPAGYTYDPNDHYADNDHTSITIQMLKLNPWDTSSGDGSGIYKPVTVSNLGTYRATLRSRSDLIYFSYCPFASGRYSLESWVDIVQNEVNPIMDRYGGSTQYNWLEAQQNDGGSFSSFTKNFRMLVALSEPEVGNVWKFAVHADVVDESLYPVIVDFTIKYEDGFVRNDDVFEMVEPHGPYATDNWWEENPVAGANFRYAFKDTNNLMDPSRFALNPEDGFYHFFDAETGTYGDILYAMLTRDNAVFTTEGQNGFLGVTLKVEGKDYSEFMSVYKQFCKNGVHPVNAELKQFLQDYAVGQRFFDDGSGYAEGLGLVSAEDNMWMFACGYYY
ncbi:MAG: hypothetical protein J1G07_01620 [Clostridiales bacterium]|nr:hypothetical protein [Clostridiales bacterium]